MGLLTALRRKRRSALYRSAVAYWAMDGDAGAGELDRIGGNHLAQAGGVGSVEGKVGLARSFAPASSQQLTIGDNTALSTGDIFFACGAWLYLTDKSVLRAFIGKVSSSGAREWTQYYDLGNNAFAMRIYSPGSAVGTVFGTGLGNSANTWYRVWGWHDPDANQVGIAVNGVTATAATTGAPTDGAGTFRIGALDASSSFWSGYVDEAVMLKHRLPSAAELTWDYNDGNGRSLLEWQAYTSLQINLWAFLHKHWWQRGKRPPLAAVQHLPRLPAIYRGRAADLRLPLGA